MRQPILQDGAFLADVAAVREQAFPRDSAAEKSPSSLHLWWLGQSGFLIHWNGQFLLLDPYLSDSLTRKYAATDKPHVRMAERVVAPERLDFIDVQTSSHNHTDHLDPDTLRPLAEVNPGMILICPEANRATVRERSGVPDERIIGLDVPGGPRSRHQVDVGPWTVHAVAAAHEALETDAQGRHIYLGYVIQAGPWRIYHSGDTLRYDGLVERLRPFGVDIALLPINGRAPERRVAGNLWGGEAAQLARDIGARLVIPCHYDMFTFNTATPDEFVATCERIGQSYKVLQLGERLSPPPA